MNFRDCTNMPPEPQQGSKTRPFYGASISTSTRTTDRGVQNWPPLLPSGTETKYSYTRPSTSLARLISSPSPISPISSISSPSRGWAYSFGKTPLRDGLSRSNGEDGIIDRLADRRLRRFGL